MFTFEEIKKEYKEDVWRKNPKAVLVEYLQYEILDSIFKQKNSEKLSFMGGTAIRIVHNGTRFSEDLDFDNFGLSFSEFGSILEKSVLDMESKGFEIEFRLIEKGAYHAYVKFPKLLFDNNLSPHISEKILVKIDTVQKEKKFESLVFVLDKFNVYKKILVNSVDIVLSQKIIAAFERKKTKGRDFFDISFLLNRVSPNYEYLNENVNIKNQKELKKRLLKRANDLDFKKLARDIEPFLINHAEKDRVIEFKNFVKEVL